MRERRRRAHGLVRFLRVLRLRPVHARRVRQRVRAVQPRDDRADLAHGLDCEVHRVGAHVGDETDRALAEIDAFVEPLRDAHRALRAEAELARGFLLQRRGGERRRRVALALLLLDVRDDAALPRRGLLERAAHLFGPRGGRDRELLDLLARGTASAVRRELLRVLLRLRRRSVQYSRALKRAISSSRSQIMRSAGLCTRPAEAPDSPAFFHSSGERLKPTR